MADTPWGFAIENFSGERRVRLLDGTDLGQALTIMHRSVRDSEVVEQDPWWGYLYFSYSLSRELSDRIERGEPMAIAGHDGEPIELRMSRIMEGPKEHHCYLVASATP